jgi:hypothetical protein
MISSHTISILIDAGLSGETLKAVCAAIERDMETVCNMVAVTERNDVTRNVTPDVTPAALRMRRFREKKAQENNVLDAEKAASVAVTERNSVTSQGVTTYNTLTSSPEEVVEVKKDIIVRSVTRKRNSYAEQFEQFWSAFPTDPGMSKIEAAKAFDKLSPEDQALAIKAIPQFKEWCRKQGESYRTVHACRYLSQGRFQGFEHRLITAAKEAVDIARKSVPVMVDSPAWDAWKRTGRRFNPVDIKNTEGHVIGRGWYFPSEYPEQEKAA